MLSAGKRQFKYAPASQISDTLWRVLDRMRTVARQVLDFCYPGTCASCDAVSDGAMPLCAACIAKLRRMEDEPFCPRCAAPVAQPHSPCPHCLGEGLYPFERILCLGRFEDPLKHLIHQMKYHHRWPLAEFLADRLAEQERVKGLLTETERLIAVPLHRPRQVGRGYNQAQVLAARLARRCRIKRAGGIVRLKSTETQTHLHSRARRVENVRGAFGLVHDRAIRDRHVVVIDDVMTTGATLQAVGRTLLQAKPASLCAIVAAVADPLRHDFTTV